MDADVVIKALDVTNNTMLVFDSTQPLTSAQYERVGHILTKQFKDKGLSPVIILSNGLFDVEKLPTRMLRRLRDRLNGMELGERHTCLEEKDEAACRACADETR